MKANQVGVILVVFIILSIMAMGGSLSIFISGPGLLSLIGIVAGSFVFKFGFSGLKYFRHSREYRNQFCQFGSSISTNAGLICTIVGLIQLFAQFEWNNYQLLGKAISLSFTSTFYGFVLSLFFKLGMVPLESKGQAREL